MKPLILIVAILFCAVTHTQAQSAEKRTRIRYLFSLMKQDSLMLKQMDASISMMRNVTKMGSGMVRQVGVDSAAVPVDSAMLKRRDLFMQKMIRVSKDNTLKMINEDMVEIYDRYFTATEIEAFCTFYQSPAGKKLIDRTPAVSQEVMKQSMTKYQPQLMKLVKEYMDEEKQIIDSKYKK